MLTPPSKRKGSDKALFQIEQALRRVKSGKQTSEDSNVIVGLKRLLGVAAEFPTAGLSSSANASGQASSAQDARDAALSDDDNGEIEDSPDGRSYIAHHAEGSLTVDDAENPLQLLARASKLQLSPVVCNSSNSPGQLARRGGWRSHPEPEDGSSDIQSFFTGVRVNLDVGEDIDPIDMGLVTVPEAEELFE